MSKTAQNKVTLVTGASSGIGKATTEKLLAEGHIVYGAARHVEQVEELKERGGHILKMDVTSERDLQQGVQGDNGAGPYRRSVQQRRLRLVRGGRRHTA